MAFIPIKTSQNVIIQMQSAGVGRRILAFFIDLGIIVLYGYFLHKFFATFFYSFDIFTENKSDQIGFIRIIYTILLLPALLYSLCLESVTGGQTLGKRILKIKVLKLNGYQAGFSEFFIRWVFRMVDIWVFMFVSIFLSAIFSDNDYVLITFSSLFFMLTGMVAVISIASSKKSQRIGDLVAGTTVVKVKQKESINKTILQELSLDYRPKYPQVIRLSDNDARIIQQTYTNALRQKDYVTLQKLRNKLEEVMDVKAKEKDIVFIDLVMKDFNFYTQKM